MFKLNAKLKNVHTSVTNSLNVFLRKTRRKSAVVALIFDSYFGTSGLYNTVRVVLYLPIKYYQLELISSLIRTLETEVRPFISNK